MTPQIDGLPSDAPARLVDERFLLDAPVATRAWGEEFRAHHALLGSAVTVFLLAGDRDPSDASIPGAAARAQQLRLHPHLARLFETGLHQGQVFLVEEPLEGPSLVRWMADGAVTPGHATRVARQLVDGLRFAHRSGVLHGALGPDLVTMVNVDPPYAMIRGFGAASGDVTPADDVRALGELLRPLVGDEQVALLAGAQGNDEALARFDAALALTERGRGRIAVAPRVVPLPADDRTAVIVPLPLGPERRGRLGWLALAALAVGAVVAWRQCSAPRTPGPPGHDARVASPPTPTPPPSPVLAPTAPAPTRSPLVTQTPTTASTAPPPPAAPPTTAGLPLAWAERLPTDGGTLVTQLGVPVEFVARVAAPRETDRHRWLVDGQDVAQGPAWQFVPGTEHAGRAVLVQVIVDRDGAGLEHRWKVQVDPSTVRLRRRAPATDRVALPVGRAQTFSIDLGGDRGVGPFTFVWTRNTQVVARGPASRWTLRSAVTGDRRVAVTALDRRGVAYGPYTWLLAVVDEPPDAPEPIGDADSAAPARPEQPPQSLARGPRIAAASPGAGGVVPVRQGAPVRFGIEVEGANIGRVRWRLDGQLVTTGRICRLTAGWPVGGFHHLEVEVTDRRGQPVDTRFWSLKVEPAA